MPALAANHFASLTERLNDALPQTQCTRCGYPDCRAYASAMAESSADINQCPPGGADGIQRLAALTGRAVLALNPGNGHEGPRAVALIDEAWCIGCTLCLPVCPTDAILGTNKLMHTVVEPDCTGCELCIAACPVDCISLENVTGEFTGWAAWSQPQADRALQRYAFHSRLRLYSVGESSKTSLSLANQATQTVSKQSIIESALARSRAQRLK